MDRRRERRERIVLAVLELASREGVDRVTLRSVAAEAGISMGQVQHYFPSKDDMLLAAVELAVSDMEARVGARVEVLDEDEDGEILLRAILEEMLGGHPDVRRLLRLAADLAVKPGGDARISDLLAKDDQELHELTVQVIRDAQVAGRVSLVRKPEYEAMIVWALVGELGYDVSHDHRPIEEANKLLAYHLDILFGHDQMSSRSQHEQR